MADPGGDLPPTFENYRVWRSAGTLALIEPVAAGDRSAAKLDLIAAAARNVSATEARYVAAQPT